MRVELLALSPVEWAVGNKGETGPPVGVAPDTLPTAPSFVEASMTREDRLAEAEYRREAKKWLSSALWKKKFDGFHIHLMSDLISNGTITQDWIWDQVQLQLKDFVPIKGHNYIRGL